MREVNVREYKFAGGCLGCFECAISERCIYKDGFDLFLRDTIQKADAFIHAFSIENHYTHSSFKCYDDRQFCNGHRTVTTGKVTGYLISGDYEGEENLRTIVEARSSVSGMYFCGVATDEGDTKNEIEKLAKTLDFALEKNMSAPMNFYGVGGSKIFRDLVYLMKGIMQADHKFYKSHGHYDFPQNKVGMRLKMRLVGTLMKSPQAKKKMKGKMNEFIIKPYNDLLEQTEAK